jgi:hypothetical protein
MKHVQRDVRREPIREVLDNSFSQESLDAYPAESPTVQLKDFTISAYSPLNCLKNAAFRPVFSHLIGQACKTREDSEEFTRIDHEVVQKTHEQDEQGRIRSENRTSPFQVKKVRNESWVHSESEPDLKPENPIKIALNWKGFVSK